MADLGLIALVLLAYAVFSRPLARINVTAPTVFVVAGVLAGPEVLGIVSLDITEGIGLVVAELALVVVLFTDASRIDLRTLRGSAALPVRLLAIGMPLSIALGVLTATLLVTDLDLWEGAIIAAILAPTDAALGKAVVTSSRIPMRIRQAINVESGLNDGLSIPFLFLFLGLAVDEASGTDGWILFAIEQLGFGVLAGVVLGGAASWAIANAVRREMITGAFREISIAAVAVIVWAAAGEIGGNGFIAAFTAGLVASRLAPTSSPHMLDFAEDEGELLNLAVFFIFGVALLEFLGHLTWEIALFSLLSLTVIRMVPVALSMIGTGLSPRSVAFIAWFGPRGLASIILALVVHEEQPELPALDFILAAMALTVLLSVIAHGASARPLTNRYGRRAEAMKSDAPEWGSHPEIPARGRGEDDDRGD